VSLTDPPIEPDWGEVHRRALRRASASVFVVGCPIAALVIVLGVIQPHAYSSGDIRNDPLFWVIAAGAALTFVAVLFVLAVRELRRP
jgi:uncharacterized membrane protein